MPILDRFEIGLGKEMVSGVIFGVEYLILIEGIKCLTICFFPQQPKLKTTTNTIIFKFFSR